MNATPMIPVPVNEPVLSYAPGTTERLELKRTLKDLSSRQLEIPLVIGGKEVRTGKTIDAVMPHCHHHVLAKVHQGGPAEVRAAIAAAGEAWHDWSGWDLGRRAAVFLKAAELLATRYLEPPRPPPARGVRVRDHAVQLHVDRRQPPHGARAYGQHRGLEAGRDGGLLELFHPHAARGSRPATGRHQLRARPSGADLR